MVYGTTDDTLSMTVEKASLVNQLAEEDGHTVIGYHCMIDEEALHAKAGLKAIQEVMQTVTKVVSCISTWALHKRQFFIDGDRICVDRAENIQQCSFA